MVLAALIAASELSKWFARTQTFVRYDEIYTGDRFT